MPFVVAGSMITSASQIANGLIVDAHVNAAAAIAASKLAITQQLTLLKANSGTDVSAAAANVDTIAISGLTAKDRLLIIASLQSDTQATAKPEIYNNTDAVDVYLPLGVNALAANGKQLITAYIGQRQSGATAVVACGLSQGTFAQGTQITESTFVTAWTGAWTLALRHNGVTAGGTLRWSWSVYKLVGQ